METWVHTNAQATNKTDGVQDNTINIFARIRADFNAYGGLHGFTASLKDKWWSLCCQQPLLASTVASGETRHVPDLYADPEYVTKWLKSSFYVITDDYADGAHDAYGDLPSVDKATLYFFPKTQDVLIRTPHYLIDGIGHLMLIERLLQMVSSGSCSSSKATTTTHIRSANTIELLSPTFEDALNLPEPNVAALEDVKSFVDLFQRGEYPPTGLRFRSSKSASRCRKLIQRFSTAKSMAILKACKAKGFTITHLFHAAAMMASQRLNPTSGRGGLYSTGTAFDLRGRCLPPFNSDKHACTVYLLPRFVIVQQGSFEDTIGQFKAFYRSEWDRPGLRPSIVPFLQQMDRLSQKFATAPPMSSIGMSSFGDLRRWMSRSHGIGQERIHVEEISITAETIAPAIALHLWSWGDQISMQMEWNDKYYATEDMIYYQRAILHEIQSSFELEIGKVLESANEALKIT
jgi:hypothetical protein